LDLHRPRRRLLLGAGAHETFPASAKTSSAFPATAARLAGPALAALALAVYANSWSAPLVFDDFPAIRDTPDDSPPR
jgi:hypothetical protein